LIVLLAAIGVDNITTFVVGFAREGKRRLFFNLGIIIIIIKRQEFCWINEAQGGFNSKKLVNKYFHLI
jgi:hypothetical protein